MENRKDDGTESDEFEDVLAEQSFGQEQTNSTNTKSQTNTITTNSEHIRKILPLKDYEQIMEKIWSLQTQNQGLQKQLDKANQNDQQIVSEKNCLSQKVNEIMIKLQQTQQQRDQALKQKETLQKQLKEQQQLTQKLKLSDQSSIHIDVPSEVNSKMEQIKDFGEVSMILSKGLPQIQLPKDCEQCRIKDIDFKRLQFQFSQAKKQNQNISSLNEKLTQKMESLKTEIEELNQKFEKQSQSLKLQSSMVKQALDDVELQLQRKIDFINKLTFKVLNDKQNLLSSYSEVNISMTKSKSSQEHDQSILNKLQQKIDQNETKIKQISQINQSLTNDLNSSKEKETLQRAQIERLQRELDEQLNKHQNNVKNLQQNLRQISDQNLDLQNQLFITQKKCQKLINDIQSIKAQRNSLESQIQHLTQSLKQNEIQINDGKNRIKSIESQIESVKNQKKLLNEKVETIQSQKKLQIQRNRQLELHLRQSEQKLSLLANSSGEEITKLQNDIFKQRNQIEIKLVDKISLCQKLQTQAEDYHNQITSLKSQLETTKTEKKLQKQEFQQIKINLTNQIQSLKISLSTFVRSHETDNAINEQRIAELQASEKKFKKDIQDFVAKYEEKCKKMKKMQEEAEAKSYDEKLMSEENKKLIEKDMLRTQQLRVLQIELNQANQKHKLINQQLMDKSNLANMFEKQLSKVKIQHQEVKYKLRTIQNPQTTQQKKTIIRKWFKSRQNLINYKYQNLKQSMHQIKQIQQDIQLMNWIQEYFRIIASGLDHLNFCQEIN